MSKAAASQPRTALVTVSVVSQAIEKASPLGNRRGVDQPGCAYLTPVDSLM